MDIKIYSSPGCFYCEQMKELCRRAEVEYELIDVGKDIFRPEFLKLYPEAQSFPYVIIDDEPIGGLVEAAKYFIKEGLISVPK